MEGAVKMVGRYWSVGGNFPKWGDSNIDPKIL